VLVNLVEHGLFGDGDDKCQRLNLFDQDRGDMRKADGLG
jgi:hypothetical protein